MTSSCEAALKHGGPPKCWTCMRKAYAAGSLHTAGCDGTDANAFCFGESDDSAQPSEEAWPTSPRGGGAGKTAGLTKAESEYVHGVREIVSL